jgi:hypothetical protein
VPVAVVASRSTATSGDPHGIVLGELLAGELLRRTRVAELGNVHVVSVVAGRSGSLVSLSESVEDRPLLEPKYGPRPASRDEWMSRVHRSRT